jgi:ankyrin repeat protein
VDGSGDAAVVPLLTYFLDRGVDPAAPDASGFTPLHNAAGYGALISRPAFLLSWNDE